MANFILRPAREEDREKIISIFTASFGDGEAFVRDLLAVSHLLPSACCAEMDGEVRSCMFAFHGLSLGNIKLSYLYALCTEPAYRGLGMGKAVAEYASRCARAKGAEAVFLRAGDEGLQRWYMSTLGAVPMACSAAVKLHTVPAADKATVIGPAEYMALRGGDWLLSPSLLLAQDCILRYFGGAFLRLGSNTACVEKREDGLLIRELSGPEPKTMLAAVAAHFGANELFVLREAPSGSPLLFLPPVSSLFPEAGAVFPFPLD